MGSTDKAETEYRKTKRSEAQFLPNVLVWAIPLFLAAGGVGYTLFEHNLHQGEPGWPWITFPALLLLGLIGPGMAWIGLRWSARIAEDYMQAKQLVVDRVEQLKLLNTLIMHSCQAIDFDEAMARILASCMDSLDATAGMVFIREADEPGLRLQAQRGITPEMAEHEVRIFPDDCRCGQALATKVVHFASDPDKHPDCNSCFSEVEGFKSLTCVPLEGADGMIGLMQLASPVEGHFGEKSKAFLAAIADHVSSSMERAQLNQQMRDFNIDLEKTVGHRTQELESARWALVEKTRRLQRLLSESYRIQEDTQARIAHDMHDGVTQIIIGSLYETQAARLLIEDDPQTATAHLLRAQDLLSGVESELRRVIFDLHPPVLDMMGVIAAIKRYAGPYSDTFNIPTTCNVIGVSRRLDKAVEIGIYRIMQEALHNVAAHSEARHVKVTFEVKADRFEASVKDDGVGFNPDDFFGAPGDHLGLIGMKERAEGINAQLTVSSEVGQGTTVSLRIAAPDYIEQPSDSEIEVSETHKT
jgi:signal transduction histidine kinase